MPKGYKGVSLPEDLIKAIETYIKENPSTAYKSKADFITDAIRKRLEELGALPPTLTLMHINVAENYVLLWEKKPGEEKGHSVEVFFENDKVKCRYCDSNRCYHVKFAVQLPEVKREFERRKRLGMKIPDLSYLEEEENV